MGTLTEKLDYLKETKNQIKEAIISKGQEVSSSDTFRSYASKIAAIENGDVITATNTTGSTVTVDDRVWVEPVRIGTRHFNVYGNPTIDDSTGIVKLNSTTDYINVTNLSGINPTTSLEIVVKIKKEVLSTSGAGGETFFATFAQSSSNASSTINTRFSIWDNKFSNYYGWYSPEGSGAGANNIATNEWVWLKYKVENGTRISSYSFDGESWTTAISGSAAAIANYNFTSYPVIVFGINTSAGTLSSSNVEFDLSETYIKVDDEYYWQPYTFTDAYSIIPSAGITSTSFTGIAQANIANNASGSVKTILDGNGTYAPTLGTKVITRNNTYSASTDNLYGYSSVTVNVEDIPAVVESLSITPTTSAQSFTPTSGVDGYSPVTVSAVTSSIDANIVEGNIKSGVSILGVTGSLVESNNTTASVTPTTSAQTITPTSPYNGFDEISVSAVTAAIDPDITPENIVEGVNILGVTGTAEITTLDVTTPRLVVVNNGTDGVAYSDDGGNTWSESEMPVTAEWRSIAFGNGRYVVIVETSNTTIGAYSDDGINWTESTMPSGKYYSVCYGNGKFVAISRGSSTFAYSIDGETWTAVTVPVSKNWDQIAYGNGKFVALSSSNSTFVYSEDGINWTESTDTTCGHIMFGGGKFISSVSQAIKYSSDGINWTAATLPTLPSSAEEANIYNVVYDGTVYLAVCLGHSNTGYLTLISSDGATWSFTSSTTAYLSETYNTAYNLKNVKYDGKNFVGLTRNGQYTFTAGSDGLWTITENDPALTGTDWNGLCYGEPVTGTTTVDAMLNEINGENIDNYNELDDALDELNGESA